MDLSFARFDRYRELTLLPGDLAVLMVGVAARQAASPTAAAQAGMPPPAAPLPPPPEPVLLAPADGAFHEGMATLIVRWREA